MYGEAPVVVPMDPVGGDNPRDLIAANFREFMHYLYLPVRIPERDLRSLPDGVRDPQGSWFRLPERLWWLADAVRVAVNDARQQDHLVDPYVYVTARRGYATPGNPLNRPGWHCDDFGGTDLNYIYADRYPTRVLLADEPLQVSADDAQSMVDMTAHADRACTDRRDGVRIEDAPLGRLLRLTPHVIHDTPIIPKPGGMRSFVKISVSDHRFDLVGNSHNYLLDYDWPMYDREAVRNVTNRDHAPR